jgi:hypothetical protein
MFESRCGVRCSVCERREKGICPGCLIMEKPFWGGTCKVRTCCMQKNIDHCGQCQSFPCTILSEMGKDAGFDPAVKIAQCRAWRDEEKK